MNNTEKLVFSPEKCKTSETKLDNILKIVLQIAKIDGYDSDYRIKDKSGNSIKNTNILNFLKDLLSENKNLNFSKDYIELLCRAKINPIMIDNSYVCSNYSNMSKTNVESKLIKRKKQSWIYP